MDCRTVRERLVREPEPDAEVRIHLESCAGCAAFARRLGLARDVLRTPASALDPDPGFARRVASRLPQTSELLGWAALRALPAALALALALSWIDGRLLSQTGPLEGPASLLADEPDSALVFAYAELVPSGEALP
jgi:hypothetical protein